MGQDLSLWKRLFDQRKQHAVCLDIETSGIGGHITVIGFYRPIDGVIEADQLIKGVNLTREAIREQLTGCNLFIVFNGISHDLKRIEAEFPGVIPPGIPVLDLYRVARRLGLNTNLKVLEGMFEIERPDESTQVRGIAVKLWQRYVRYGDQQALNKLLNYNSQDAINLYPLAKYLLERVNTVAIRCAGGITAKAELVSVT